MVSRMAKPEEVLVVENDQGEVVREFMKDTDAINLYKNMRETLGKLQHVCADKNMLLLQVHAFKNIRHFLEPEVSQLSLFIPTLTRIHHAEFIYIVLHLLDWPGWGLLIYILYMGQEMC